MVQKQRFQLGNSVLWNLFLITLGVTIFSIGVKGIAIHHSFIASGIFGTGMLIYYASELFSPSVWYFLLNIPIFILGWVMLSQRFIFYSIYGFIATSIISELINFNAGIQDPMIAAITTGIVCGAGMGIILHSLGSDGGVTIISIILHQKYSLRMGQTSFLYNLLLFAVALTVLDLEKIMYSLISLFISSSLMDSIVSMFDHRKMALIISDNYEAISKKIMDEMSRGVTYLHGSGAFTGKDKKVLLTVVQNHQIKRLEETVFSVDPDAFVIIENTFNVLGTGFSKPKRY